MSSNKNKLLPLFFIVLLLILSFRPLNTEIQTIATAPEANSLEQIFGELFPYIWIFFIVAASVGLAYLALKGGS